MSLIISWNSTISFNLARIKSLIKFCGIMLSIRFNLLQGSRDFIATFSFSVCFSKTFPKEEYANFSCSVICL